ncbi:Hypothetical protein, putative [Bodo saltans]|uniref:Membrane-associated protein n=1 Tax=Bodo saltans TaxID=75058 RepID=A0A0S4IQ41_BODSA|nr:Hypothetical protein, putative [Bodo saltans]|eukprot:CUE80142.1 Hypothetical protein, putative [Bodo saltans]
MKALRRSAMAAIVCTALLCLQFGSVHAEEDAPVRLLRLEHVYCDPLTKSEQLHAAASAAAHSSAPQPPSMVAKAKCKGSSCPTLDGKPVTIVDCKWESVNDKKVFLEEVSGWYYFYHDEARTQPLRPTEDEMRRLNSGEVGYLKHQCGALQYRPSPV